VRPIRELDHDVLKRFALSVGAQQATVSIFFLGEGAPPAIGFRLGPQDGVHDLLFVGARPQPLDTSLGRRLGDRGPHQRLRRLEVMAAMLAAKVDGEIERSKMRFVAAETAERPAAFTINQSKVRPRRGTVTPFLPDR
jgi:hypothetical protein